MEAEETGSHFPDDIIKIMKFTEWNIKISITISLKRTPKGPINDISPLVQIMAWRGPGNKPFSEPMMADCTDACMRHSASMS